jgi:hypothetical protein
MQALRIIVRSAALSILVGLGSASPGSAISQPAAYRPGLGDLMVMTIQPRHIKLALAGQQKNWPLARYELQQLEEALGRGAETWPKWKGMPVTGMVEGITRGPMAAVAQAVKNGDAERFKASFAELTEGCNACHQVANVGMNVITVPDAPGFPDQDFRPVKP